MMVATAGSSSGRMGSIANTLGVGDPATMESYNRPNVKTHLRIIAAGLLAVGIVTTGRPQEAPKPGDNLVKNGGFETGGTHDAAQWDEIWPRTLMVTGPKFDRSK